MTRTASGSIFKRIIRIYNGSAGVLSGFASKKYSLPAFVLIAFSGFFLTALIGGYNVFGFDTEMQFTFYQFYLCDFSAGFVSRVIVGAVTSLFLDAVSVEQMTLIANAAVAVSFALFALVIGAVLKKGLSQRAFVPVLLALVLMFEPVVVQSNYMFLGTLDVYSLIIFLATLCFYGTPLYFIAAPVLSLLGMTVHYHYMFSFLPAVAALLVYDIFLAGRKSRRILGGAGLCITALSGGAAFLYFAFFAKNHLKCTADEFYELMASRFDVSAFRQIGLKKLMDGNIVFRDYFDYYIFGYNKGAYYYDSASDFIDFLRRDRIARAPLSLYVKYFALALPVILAFAALWIYCARRQKGKGRLPYIAFACIILALFPELFISSDVPRWFSMTLTCQFALLFAVYLKGDACVRDIFRHMPDEKRFSAKIVCVLCAAIYVSAVLTAGTDMPMFM